ncbi:YbjN domain-containing protein [Nitriliruptor alkaliphilus]|uniref:YbjN domain-containing protein n=1 Tax=Nitriliruptor alkaliphilus TaxID=427918 RepID=UPI000698A364|nr:YbjN domain-containing protein [Nitriliruptor alkaliphilus]
MSDEHLRDRARTALLAALDDAELDVTSVGEDRWITMLSGEWKRTIPLLLHLDERSLKLTSLLAGVPDDGHVEVYRILLSRNQRPTPVHFGLDDEGDLILTGAVPLEVVDADRLDELLGLVLSLSDETFNAVLRAGFGDYIASEQAWRAKVGLPPNPVAAS